MGAHGVLLGSQRKGRKKILAVRLPILLGSFFKETAVVLSDLLLKIFKSEFI